MTDILGNELEVAVPLGRSERELTIVIITNYTIPHSIYETMQTAPVICCQDDLCQFYREKFDRLLSEYIDHGTDPIAHTELWIVNLSLKLSFPVLGHLQGNSVCPSVCYAFNQFHYCLLKKLQNKQLSKQFVHNRTKLLVQRHAMFKVDASTEVQKEKRLYLNVQ